MFLLCCCGNNGTTADGTTGGGEQTGATAVVRNAECVSQQPQHHPETGDEPVVIEPIPDVTSLQLSHSSASPEKSIVVAPTPRNWETFEEISPQKDYISTSPSPPSPRVVATTPAVAASALSATGKNSALNAISGEQVDMRSALDERISTRDYILSITDEKLSRLPIAFVESFYPHLSPSEIMQLEQRLCELKSRAPDERPHPEPLPVESENFLRSYHPQITIRTDTGFRVENKRSSQNGLDIRQLIFAAKNQKIGPLDPEVLKQLQPFLSITEFQDISEKMGIPKSLLQKQQPDLQLPDLKKESSAASSYAYNAPSVNSNIYHLTTEPSFSADESVCSDDATESNAAMKTLSPAPPPLIKITDMDTANRMADKPNSPNEQVVKSLVDDILLNL